MYFLSLLLLLGIVPARGFSPVATLMDCPDIPPQTGVKIDEIMGTWRVAYLFIDDTDDLEEESTCAIAEISRNETKMELLFYMDTKKDEFTIDRYMKDFAATILTPEQWLVNVSFMNLEFVHVTVIGFTDDHLILTFCANPFTSWKTSTSTQASNHDSLDSSSKSKLKEIFHSRNYNNVFKNFNDFSFKLEKHSRMRHPLRFRNKRFSRSISEELSYKKMMEYLNKSMGEPMKHLWTAILVKNNNVSALKFVENASLLMKYGFKITRGQLISFGGCDFKKK